MSRNPNDREGAPRLAARDPAVLAALALIAVATLTPGGGRGGWAPGLPDPADVLVNIAVFLPLGLALRRYRWTVVRVLVVAVLISLVVEVAQLTIVPGRDADPWDVAANVTGALLGFTAPLALLALPLVPIWLASGWLLAPTPPPSDHWFGQWSHQFSSPEPFRGVIEAVALNGVPAPGGALGQSATDRMKAAFRRPPLTFPVRLTAPAGPSPTRVHVAGVADGHGAEVVGFWQIGSDLELTWYARGTRLGLRSPSLRFPGLFDLPGGTAVALEARIRPTRVDMAITDDRHGAQRRVRLGPWQGWRLFWPITPPVPVLAWFLSTVWTAGCIGLPVVVVWRRVPRAVRRDRTDWRTAS